jgi:hypothetical protein
MSAAKPTASDAWDHVHRLFGIGEWTEDSGVPWWQYRQEQAGRLKARMTRLGQTPEDVMLEADYCHAEGITIRNALWVLKHYYEAKRWGEQRENERSRGDLEARIDDAIAYEMDLDKDSPWISRLMLAQGDYRRQAVEEWEDWRRSSRSPEKLRANPTA